jgi:DNA-binding transcriptional MerR regulator
MDTQYTIEQLSELTGVPVRTIRSYVEKGLLKAPPHRGPKTRYYEEHRKVLETIRLLKHQGIKGISGIRDYLDSMSPEEIEEIFHQTSTRNELKDSSKSGASGGGIGMSTLEFISSARKRANSKNLRPRRKSWGPDFSQVLEKELAEKSPASRNSVERSAYASSWTEFRVSDDVKIVVRGTLDVDEERNFGKIARFVRKLLRKSLGDDNRHKHERK